MSTEKVLTDRAAVNLIDGGSRRRARGTTMVIDIVLERLNAKGSSSCDVESRMSNVESSPACTGDSSLNPARRLLAASYS